MALSREKKEQIVMDLIDKSAKSEALILTDYRGLSVSEINDLRNRLRETNTAYQVVKNNLTKLAMEKTGRSIPDALLEGPTAIAFCYDDVTTSAKVITGFSQEMEVFWLNP